MVLFALGLIEIADITLIILVAFSPLVSVAQTVALH